MRSIAVALKCSVVGFLRQICSKILRTIDCIVPKAPNLLIATFPDGDDQGVALCLALKASNWGGRVYWLLNKKDALPQGWAEQRGLSPLKLRFYRRQSLAGLWIFMRVRWVFYTHGLYLSYEPPASKIVVNLWHGMPIKRIWRGLPGASTPPLSTFLLSTSPFYTKVLMRASGFDRSRILETGLPRNDLLSKARPEVVEAGARLRGRATRLILFLPTYRKSRVGYITHDGNESGDLLGLGPEDAVGLHDWLKKHNCRLLVKPHPMSVHVGSEFPDDDYWAMVDERALIREGIGLYELLSQADLLITDVSSIYVDFLTTDRPQIFFFPDKQKYQQSRGTLLNPLEDYVPGPIVQDWAHLKNALDVWHSGDDLWIARRMHLRQLMVSSQTESASQAILEKTGVLGKKKVPDNGKSRHVVALLWAQYGPYHFARALAVQSFASGWLQILPLEIGSKSENYQWERKVGSENLSTLFPGLSAESLPASSIYRRALSYFRKNAVNVVFVPSYWPVGSFAAMMAAQTAGARTVMMTDSHARTAKAKGVFAWIKRRLVKKFDSALVAGEPQRAYYMSLGFSPDKIVTGYNAIDNQYFSQTASDAKSKMRSLEVRRKYGLPSRYFLYVGRMLWMKNIESLIDAYKQLKDKIGSECPALVLVGGGELELSLRERCIGLGLSVCQGKYDSVQVSGLVFDVYFLGFQQTDILPELYALAECLVLPSCSETWGLVVNEAMACGLPVVVSEAAGCARDLVKHGENGYVFPPFDVDALAMYLETIARHPELVAKFGDVSRKIISEWGCERFAEAAGEAVRIACSSRKERRPKVLWLQHAATLLLMVAIDIYQIIAKKTR